MKQRTEERREESVRRTSPFDGSLSAPLQDASVPVGTSVQRSVAILGAVAVGARHALRSPDGPLGRVQQPIQHLADGAVLAIERVGVHLRLRSRQPTFEHDLLPFGGTILLDFTQGEGNFLRQNSVGTFSHFLRLYAPAFSAVLAFGSRLQEVKTCSS